MQGRQDRGDSSAILFTLVPFVIGLAMFGLVVYNVGLVANLVLCGIGIVLWSFSGWAAMFKKYYIIAESHEAIIRTGKGGNKHKSVPTEDGVATVIPESSVVAIGTGLWSIPLFHRHRLLKLQQYVFPIDKTGKSALLCKDSILADVNGTFKVTVQRDPASILRFLDAAGDRDINSEDTMRKLCLDTLETSLRDAGTSKEYLELFEGRDEVGKEIEKSVENDFTKIGVSLSVAKLTDVNPAPESAYQEGNLQHAVGKTKIVKITEDERRNQEIKKLEISKEIRDQQVTTAKEILTLDQSEKFAQAEQEREVAVKRAEENKQSRQAHIAAEEEVAKREIAKEKAVEIERVDREKVVEAALVDKQKAIETAGVKKKEAIEVAEQDRDIAVAKKESELAAAEEAKAKAEALAEKERQSIVTVQVVETAQRDKQKAVIDQEAASERDLIKAQKAADASAYAVERDAEARQTAAEADFQAKVKAAEADLTTKTKAAEGRRAEEMVPVEVNKAQVEVDARKVEVLKSELAAKEEHSLIASQLEITLKTIDADKDAKVAFAQAMGAAIGGANMQVFGTPETMQEMLGMFSKGQSITNLLAGLTGNTTKESQEIVKDAISGVGEIAGAVISKINKTKVLQEGEIAGN